MEKEHLTLEKMANTYREHDANDAREFTAINKKLDRREEIAIINGQHLSAINKNMEEINKTIQDIILPHITAVSPILVEFQERKETERTITRITMKIKKYGLVVVFLSSVIGGLVIIKNFLIK